MRTVRYSHISGRALLAIAPCRRDLFDDIIIINCRGSCHCVVLRVIFIRGDEPIEASRHGAARYWPPAPWDRETDLGNQASCCGNLNAPGEVFCVGRLRVRVCLCCCWRGAFVCVCVVEHTSREVDGLT